MMAWLWSHVTLGIVAVALASLHAGYGLISPRMSTGKVAFAILALLFVSGVVWRIVYRVVPPMAARRIGNYAEDASKRRADEQMVEIDKISAGRSPNFRALKDAIVARQVPPGDLPRHLASFSPEERTQLEEIQRLATSRERALERQHQQHKYGRLLQMWRWLHVPLTAVFVPALALHVFFALDLPHRALPKQATPPEWSGFSTSDTCVPCHKTIHDEWKQSMHARAMTTPVMIAQNNQLLRAELGKTKAPDPRGLCVNCHGPAGVSLSEGFTLPLSHSLGDSELLNEGISCAVCHQHRGKPAPGQGGLSVFQASFVRGSTYYGPIRAPVC